MEEGSMKQLLAIGEALIDFAPEETGKELKDVSAFKPKVGGAPANVCGAYVKLGGEAATILSPNGSSPSCVFKAAAPPSVT